MHKLQPLDRATGADGRASACAVVPHCGVSVSPLCRNPERRAAQGPSVRKHEVPMQYGPCVWLRLRSSLLRSRRIMSPRPSLLRDSAQHRPPPMTAMSARAGPVSQSQVRYDSTDNTPRAMLAWPCPWGDVGAMAWQWHGHGPWALGDGRSGQMADAGMGGVSACGCVTRWCARHATRVNRTAEAMPPAPRLASQHAESMAINK